MKDWRHAEEQLFAFKEIGMDYKVSPMSPLYRFGSAPFLVSIRTGEREVAEKVTK